MAFEDDLRNTLLDARAEHARRQEESKAFEKKWSDLRMEILGPVLGAAIPVLNELGREGKKDFYNGSIGLSFGIKEEDQVRPSWIQSLTFKPDDSQKAIIATYSTRKEPQTIPVDRFDRAAVERIVADFLREAEEALISREK